MLQSRLWTSINWKPHTHSDDTHTPRTYTTTLGCQVRLERRDRCCCYCCNYGAGKAFLSHSLSVIHSSIYRSIYLFLTSNSIIAQQHAFIATTYPGRSCSKSVFRFSSKLRRSASAVQRSCITSGNNETTQ